MTAEDDDRTEDLLRRTFASREELADPEAVGRLEQALARPRSLPPGGWVAVAAAVAASIAAAVVLVPRGSEPDAAPPTPDGCATPTVTLDGDEPIQTWSVGTGRTFALAPLVRVGSASSTEFKISRLEVVIGGPDADAGALVTKEFALRKGYQVARPKLRFVPTQTGRHPVRAVVKGTCSNSRVIGSSLLGYVDVTYSPNTPCEFVEFEGRRYRLSEDQPQMGPAKLLGEGQGSGCGSEKDGPVEVYQPSEESEKLGLSIVYGEVGPQHYTRVDLPPDLAVITHRTTSNAADQARVTGTLRSANGCVVLANGGSTQFLVFDARYVRVQGDVLHVGSVTEPDLPWRSLTLDDEVEFGGGYRSGGLAGLDSSFTVPPACADAEVTDSQIAYVN